MTPPSPRPRPSRWWLLPAGVALLGAAPMQCPETDRPLMDTAPEAPEECYALAGRLFERGDLAGWRTALEYVIERFHDSRYAAMARDDLDRGRPSSPLPAAPDAGP